MGGQHEQGLVCETVPLRPHSATASQLGQKVLHQICLLRPLLPRSDLRKPQAPSCTAPSCTAPSCSLTFFADESSELDLPVVCLLLSEGRVIGTQTLLKQSAKPTGGFPRAKPRAEKNTHRPEQRRRVKRVFFSCRKSLTTKNNVKFLQMWPEFL